MFTNKSAIKIALLEKAEKQTPGRFTCVSPSVFEKIEQQVDVLLTSFILNQPADGGKTIK